MSQKRWSRQVTQRSNALDLPPNLFKRSGKAIAAGLKQSADKRSPRRSKARSHYQAAMSMLNLYVNRAGKNLSRADRARLASAKQELRRRYGRDL
jgi:hypothetical protein